MDTVENNSEITISLSDMFFSICYHWKRILLVICACIIIGGVILVMPEKKTEAGEGNLNFKYEQYLETKKNLESDIAHLEKKISNQEDYMRESILMNMDPRRVYQAKLSLYVETDYKIMPDMVYQNPDNTYLILAAYENLLGSDKVMGEIAEEMEIDPWYLEELISIEGEMDHVLNVVVTYRDEEGCARIMEALRSNLEEIKKQVLADVGRHSAQIVLDTVSLHTQDELLERQNTELKNLSDSRQLLLETRDALEDLKDPSEKSAAKTLVLAVLVGGFLSCCYYAVKFLTSGKVYSAKEFRERSGLKVLGTLSPEKKADPVTRLFIKLEGRTPDRSPERFALLAANVRNYSGEASDLMVAGDACADTCEAIVKELQTLLPDKKLSYCGHLLRDAQCVAALPDHDGVILIEQAQVSGYRAISQETERIRDAGAVLVGSIVVE